MVKKLKTFALFLLIYFFIIPIKASEKKNLIAHAGGEIDSYIYTNSYEAVMKSIKNGYKYIEMDHATNYLIMYCIYECNNSLNNFIEIFKKNI